MSDDITFAFMCYENDHLPLYPVRENSVYCYHLLLRRLGIKVVSIFISCRDSPPLGQGLLIIEAPRSYSDTTQPV